MGLIDWGVIVIYFVIIAIIGLSYYKRASSGLEDYFVSGRKLSWWIAGTSMVATTFAADTPLAVTGLTISDGISGNWVWWSMALTGMLTVIFFSKMWRRSRILTDVEFTELRYSGKPAAFLRGFRSIYLGVLINVIIMGGFVTVAMIKIVQYVIFNGAALTLTQKFLVVGISFLIAALYSTVSGLWGVVVTDFIQFILAMLGSIALAFVSVSKAGGISNITKKITASQPDLLNLFPDWGSSAFIVVVVFLTVQWWASWYPGAEPGGGGYSAQRMFSCKDERHSFLSTLWFAIAHYAVRPWPWILTALSAYVLFGKTADPESMYPMMINQYMPIGLKGLMMTAFFAAYMSTITTHLNWGASYVINDFYKRFLAQNKTEKHYVSASRWVTIGLMFISVIPALYFDSIKDAWIYILTIGAGTGLVLILRWFWKRINAFSEISAMAASFIISTVLILLNKFGGIKFTAHATLNDAVTLMITVGFTTIAWIIVTLVTKPESDEFLLAFYKKVKPVGVVFKPANREGYISGKRILPDIFRWLLGCVMIYAFLFGAGKVILGITFLNILLGIGLITLGALIFIYFFRYSKKNA